jgi:hypothetical protein
MNCKTKAGCWKGTAIPIACCIVVPFSGEGLASQFPIMDVKLSRALPALAEWEILHLLKFGSVVALFLVLVACVIWTRFLTGWFAGKVGIPAGVRSDREDHYVKFSLALAACILGFDALMFYLGIRQEVSGWGEPALIVPSAVIGTVMYVCCSIFISFQSFNIRYAEEP